MIIARNIIILLLNAALGALVGLEMKYSLLGKLFIEPYRGWMVTFFFALFLLWALISILITRKWSWSVGGGALALLFAGGIAKGESLLILPSSSWITFALVLFFVIVGIFIASFYAEASSALSGYLMHARRQKVSISSSAGPFWFLLSVILGIIAGISLYNAWLPSEYLSLFSSPESFRLAFYLFFATLGGFLTLSAAWSALSAFFFIFACEFTFMILYIAYASLTQLFSEIALVFLDPARITMPLVMLLVGTLWGGCSGHFIHRFFYLREGKREAEMEKLTLAAMPSEGQGPPTSVSCPACGREIPSDAQYCTSCGQKLETPSSEP